MEINTQTGDLDVITCREAGRFLGMKDTGFKRRMIRRPEFRSAVAVDMGPCATVRISLPRLCRFVHGTEADRLIPEWRRRLSSWRSAGVE